MKTNLGANAKKEMIDCIQKCNTPAEIRREVARLAEANGCTKETVYRLTKSVRPSRKTRTDKGDRVVDIRSDQTFKLMLGWMLNFDMTAADAYRTAQERGFDLPVVLETFERWLREQGLTEKTRRRNLTPHRRFEASAPGEMFQFDISGLKQRWYDHETRKIITVPETEVSKNHENAKASRTKVWRFALIDDYSRRCFVRYVGVAKPCSSHVVDFLLQAYAELGVPAKLYTDNDQIIKFGRNKRATEILNKILSDQGGYENIFHMPGVSRATGKVERLHQTVERCEKAIGQYLEERGPLSLEMLNESLAPRIEQHINTKVHSETGMAPMARWESAFSVIRRVKYEDLRAAFAADEFTVKLRGDLTFRLKGTSYQLPTTELYPFASWIGQKLTVVFHDDLDHFTVLGLDGNEYDIVKDTQRPDVAGEFQSTASTAEQLRKEAKALAKEDAKRIKAGREIAPIPIFDRDIAAVADETNVTRFPKPETTVDASRVPEIAPGRVSSGYSGVSLDYWSAYEALRGEFANAAEAKAFLDTIYPSRDGGDKFLESEVREALATRTADNPVRILKAV
jgi:transposase InsO family protein